MLSDTLKKIFTDKKLLLTLGALPLAVFAFKKIKSAAHRHHAALMSEKQPPKKPVRSLTLARKNRMVKAVVDRLKSIESEEFVYRFAQSVKRGYRGYYIIGPSAHWILLCWSNEFEAANGVTPFWLELDETTAKTFAASGIIATADAYPHPSVSGRIVIALTPEEMGRTASVAEKVLAIARASLVV